MKGLLLKDFYALLSYMRFSLILNIVFILVGAFGDAGSVITLFPCFMVGIIAMSLIAYEEREGWHIYAAALPYSRATLVSSKYLMTLLFGGVTIVAILAIQAVSMAVGGHLDTPTLGGLGASLLIVTLLPTAILLPFIFRFGPERGRLLYYLVLGAFVAIGTLLDQSSAKLELPIDPNLLSLLLPLLTAGLFALSWFISIRVYRKREF